MGRPEMIMGRLFCKFMHLLLATDDAGFMDFCIHKRSRAFTMQFDLQGPGSFTSLFVCCILRMKI